jgi:hypothetical protein
MPKKARKGKFKNKGRLAIKPVPMATAGEQPRLRPIPYQQAGVRKPGAMTMEEMTNRLAHVKPELKRITIIGACVLTVLIIVSVLI